MTVNIDTQAAYTPIETRLPAEEDVIRYETLGWYISQPIIPHQLLDDTRIAIMDHQMGKRDRPLPGPADISDWTPKDGDGVRNNEFCSLQNDAVRDLISLPILGAIAARLARADSIRLFDDQAVYKPPVGAGKTAAVVGWHTDHSYWSTCTSTHMLTAWIPFEDATEENGTLRVVDGSHLWPESENMREFNNPDLTVIEKHLGRKIPESSLSAMRLKKGQVSFHHMRALHASDVNRSTTPRLALAVHMQDGRNSHRPFVTPQGRPVVLPHDVMCRSDANGNPDYTDPAVFPQLWPTPAGRHNHG